MNKTLIRLSFLVLALSTLSACNSKVHVHEYSSWRSRGEKTHTRICECGETQTANHHFNAGEVTKEPTHLVEGIRTQYCIDCGEKHLITLEKLDRHVFDQEVISDQYLATEATCSYPAIYYKSCICGEKGTTTFVSNVTIPHEITSLQLVEDETNKNYLAYEEFDKTGLKLSYTCANCEGGAIDNDEVYIQYQHNNSLRVGDTYVEACYLGKSIRINNIQVNKRDNVIEGFEDIDISCHTPLSFENVTSTYGEVEIEIKDKDGFIISKSGYSSLSEEKSPYSITAEVKDDTQYHGVSKITKQITVHHELAYNSNFLSDMCECGKKAIRNYYYDLETSQVIDGDIQGLSADKINENTVIVDAITGKEPNFSSLKAGQELGLIAKTDDGDIRFAAICITKGIETNEDLLESLWAKEHPVSGYYALLNDLYDVVTYPGEEAASGGADHLFSAVVDGGNHTIYNLHIDNKYTGLTGTNGYSKATFKNLTILNMTANYNLTGIYGYGFNQIIMDNVKIVAGQNNLSLLGGAFYGVGNISNCVFDFNGFDNVYLLYMYADASRSEPTFSNTLIINQEGKNQAISHNRTETYAHKGLTWAYVGE